MYAVYWVYTFYVDMVHPNAPLCSFKTSNNLPFCSSFRDDEMITCRVLSSPKNAYSKVLGNSLSSSFGGDSDDGLSFFSDGASCSTLDFYLLVSMVVLGQVEC